MSSIHESRTAYTYDLLVKMHPFANIQNPQGGGENSSYLTKLDEEYEQQEEDSKRTNESINQQVSILDSAKKRKS